MNLLLSSKPIQPQKVPCPSVPCPQFPVSSSSLSSPHSLLASYRSHLAQALMAQARVLKLVMRQQLRFSSVLTAVQKGWLHSPVPFSRWQERSSLERDIDQVLLAVHVPMNSEETVPEWAFAGVPRVRHVSVESGIRLIDAEAWQDCRQLRIVKLCKLLNSVLAPGCRDFGYKAFSECCSLQRVYASGGAVNVIPPI